MIVVLPAPFGPIMAWRAPTGSTRSTFSTMVSRPNAFVRPWVRSATAFFVSTSISAPCARPFSGRLAGDKAPPRQFEALFEYPDQASRCDEHDQHDDEADPEEPVNRIVLGQIILQNQIGNRADEGAVKLASPTQDEYHEHRSGQVEAEHVERDELGGLRGEPPCHT